ncbi:MAG TPA: hemerythrin domain-containing protein [Pyrinomonadaceae bacterium]|nr:hemerythrin domain-containing protein [Pyrinomonadaceae bacterium]
MAAEARQQLSDDHRAVDEVLTQLLAALDNKDVEASYSKLDLLWARLAVHIRAEHLHLFPTVINRLATDSSEAQSVVDDLRADHDFFMRELARAVAILRELPPRLDSPDAQAKWSSVVDIVASVKTRLESHNEIEENQVYRWTDTILTKPEQIDLAMRIKAELEHRPPRFSVEAWANNS